MNIALMFCGIILTVTGFYCAYIEPANEAEERSKAATVKSESCSIMLNRYDWDKNATPFLYKRGKVIKWTTMKNDDRYYEEYEPYINEKGDADLKLLHYEKNGVPR